MTFPEYKLMLIQEKLTVYDNAILEFDKAKDALVEARENLNDARKLTEEEYSKIIERDGTD